MRYLSVKEMAEKWGVSERSVRNYCVQGRVPALFLQEKSGISQIMPKSRSVPINGKRSRLPCLIF